MKHDEVYRSTPYRMLKDQLKRLMNCADEVIENWESGDLAGAVNGLREMVEEIRGGE